MVRLDSKWFLIVFVLVLFFINSGSSYAAGEGCCCFDLNSDPDDPHQLISQTVCTAFGGISFHPLIIDNGLCRNQCVPVCDVSKRSCEQAVTWCQCGTQLIDADSQYCCEMESQLFSSKDLCTDSCGSSTPTHLLYGTVKDTSNNPILGAFVRVGSGTPDPSTTTNLSGHYRLTVPQSLISVTAGKTPGFLSKTININFFTSQEYNFVLNASSTQTCGLPNKCCNSTQICVNSQGSLAQSLGARNCSVGWNCYENCSCVDISLPPEQCLPGCDHLHNSICAAGVKKNYNLNDPVQYTEYCAVCTGDAECINEPCLSIGVCDGLCSPNCDPDEDPDCGNSCNYGGSTSWCSGVGGFISPVSPPNYSALNTTIYCSHCTNPGHPETCPTTIIGSNTCQNSVWDAGREQCDNTSANPNGPCPSGETCVGCECKGNCTLREAPKDLFVKNVKRERKINLTWTLDDPLCNISISEQTIHRCKGLSTDCNVFPSTNFVSIKENIPNTTRQHNDTDNIENSTSYCYVVSAIYADGARRSSLPTCVGTGVGICMDYNTLYPSNPTSICYDNHTATCDDNNSINTITNCNPSAAPGRCVQYPDDAECKGDGNCLDCNSLYGMFSYFTLSETYSSENFLWVNYSFEGTAELRSCRLLTIDDNICYLDTTTTSVDEVDRCMNVTSCYDYKGEDACFSDNCHLNTCSWKSFNSETSLGVCTETSIDKQRCDLCTSDKNNVFPSCNKDLCETFGNCFYHKEILTNKFFCSKNSDINCEKYTDKKDCVNNSDVSFVINHSDNSNISTSQDFLGFGKCKWDNGKCYRDADDNSNTFPTTNIKRDCPTGDLVCMKDFGSPNTSLMVGTNFKSGARLRINYNVRDKNDYYLPNELTTKYCILNNTATETCGYTNSSSYVNATERIIKNEYEYKTGSNDDNYPQVLKYYSYDPAKNLEVVKTLNFNVDRKKPVLDNFSHTISSRLSNLNNENSWISDLNLSLTFHENVTCNISLEESGNIVRQLEKFSGVNTFNLSFFDLHDSNSYKLILDCFDDYNNPSINRSIDLRVEGDKSITNPLPFQERFNVTTVNISVETPNATGPVYCKYSTDNKKFADMSTPINIPVQHRFQGSFTASNNNKNHSAILILENSGVYLLYTACNISYRDPQGKEYFKVTEENFGDRILFSVDLLPPVTLVNTTYPTPENETSFEPYYQDITLKFKCADINRYRSDDNHLWYMNMYGWNGSFGCGKVFFCNVTEGQNDCFPLKKTDDPYTFSLRFSQPKMQNYTIKYYSVDAGGNAQATKSNIIKIDNILANLTMTLKKNGAIVSEVGYGDYVIDVASDKPIAAITKFELKKPAAFTDNVNAVIKTVDMGISATYIIPNNATSSKPKDKAFYNNNDGPLKFEVWIIDSHRLASSKTFNYTFDTRRPGTPTLDPIFKETNEEGYPFKYSYNSITLEDGTVYPAKTYFVRDSQLFVTGTTELSTNLGLVSLYLLKSEDPGLYQTNLKYNQTKQSNKGSAIETDSKQTTSDFSADKGATQIKLQGQHPNWAAGKYITFSKDVGRTTYNHFGKFYRITNNEFFGPQNQETRITFTPGLETSVGSNRDVYLYNESHMIYWFGINMNTDYKNPPDNNSYFLRAGLQNKNDFSALTISYNFFFDNKKPDIHLVTPAFGETLVNELQPLSIEIREDVVGSGVNKDTVNLSIKYNDGVESVYRVDTNGLLLSYVGVENNERRYQLNYTPSSPWGHGNYTIKLFLEDYAGNSYDDHGLLKSCYPSKDGCCNDAEDSVCDPDCGQDADGSYIFGKSDPDCPTNCNSTSGNCCLLLTDNICDDDCYDTWDVDCRCSIPGACDTTNNTWCYQGGWINKTSDGSKKYCDLDVCGNEDPDCFDCDKDHEGACNTLNNTWCHNVSGGYYWITEGYNLQCGPVDSDCLRLYTYTACTQNSCDVENQKVCSNSYWTNQNYSGLCKRNDFSFYECFAGDCDLFNNYVCLNTNSWTNSNYCSNYMCNTKDYNCYSTTNTCVNGVCNTDVEYYCSNNAWINTTTTYKTNCGSKDYDYGCPVCIDEKCDIDNNVWCVNDVWTDNYYCDVNACQGQDSDCGSLCSGGLTPDNCCNPSGFNVCDPDCTELQDSDCHGCTAAQGDCCVPLDDDKCDPDCTVIPDPNCAPGWVFNVDKDAPSKPNITMYGANMQIDPSNRTVVNNAPQRFELDYTRRNNGSIETLNLTTPIVEMLTPANIGVTCQNTSLRNVFSCTFNKTLTEGLYTFNTSARKYLQNGSLGGRGVHLFTVFVDLNAPQFNLTKSTSFIKPNQQLTLFANVTNTEYDLIAEITVAGQQFSLNSSYRTGSVYQFVTPADLNWGSEGEKTILFILKDYADRSTQKTTSVTVDNSTPDITITNIISEMIIITNQTNATVGTNDTNTAQLNVTIFGIVSENTKTLCYYQVGEGGVPECLLRCSIAGAGDNCIDENNQFEFQIIMNVVGEYSQEIWKTAILSAENYVGLTYSSSLYLLLDLAAPTPPDISIASS